MEATAPRGSTSIVAPGIGTAVARVGRGALAGAISLIALFAGVGVLYLIRHEAVVAAGPDVRGALPLQQLAGGEAQPLVRMVVAWVPAGFAAGLALAFLTHLRLGARSVVLALLAWVVLFLSGAAADAIAITDPLGPHLAPQFGRIGTWVAAALFTLGSVPAEWVRPTGRQ